MTITFLDFFSKLSNGPFLIIIILISLTIFMNGSSDAPNSIATCVSTRSLRPKKALILCGFCNLLGIFVMSFITTKVAETVSNIAYFGDGSSSGIIALCAGLLAVVIWAFITWKFAIPSSQSHALIAGITGASIALNRSFSAVNIEQWKKILFGLVFINLLAFILGLLITKIIEMVCKNLDRRRTNNFFKYTQIISAASMSFVDGAQEGQKFIGVILLAESLTLGTSNTNVSIPIWLMIYVSMFLALGTFVGGYRIIKTVGTKVSKLERYQGTASDLASATGLLVSTILGIPVSSTHSKNCAIVGVGASKRISNVNWGVVKNMFKAWILTFPGCGLLGFSAASIFLKIF